MRTPKFGSSFLTGILGSAGGGAPGPGGAAPGTPREVIRLGRGTG